jgi:hypothetical protein
MCSQGTSKDDDTLTYRWIRIRRPDLDPTLQFLRPLIFLNSQIPYLDYELSYPDCCMFKVKPATDKNS